MGKAGTFALMIVPIVAIAVGFPTNPETERVSSPTEVCRLLEHRERHIGETITFAGDYWRDMERSLVRPQGCGFGIGGGVVSPSVEAAFGNALNLSLADDPMMAPPGWGLRGVFTVRLTQTEPGNAMFHNDDGVRADLLDVQGALAMKTCLLAKPGETGSFENPLVGAQTARCSPR